MVERPGLCRARGYHITIGYLLGVNSRDRVYPAEIWPSSSVGQSDGVLGSLRPLEQKGARFRPQKHREDPISVIFFLFSFANYTRTADQNVTSTAGTQYSTGQ